ncbi:hypothetical protein R3Q06_33605 [Rhodococcus erythropolis]|uniref:hypothetical protein n=1 Tax=Rhodococcus erythropolis TaxID=1833 RepID=UPI0029490067|nr:hypothetical protein [Rhodococcus erythropolis]MDV6278369.1 hypothetical protein [Rhodococcus erythropolis]
MPSQRRSCTRSSATATTTSPGSGPSAARLDHRASAGARTDLYDYTDPDRPPAAETTCVHYLSLGEFAERANIPVNTMKGYRTDGRLPGEDREVGRNRGWLPETADEWITALAR